VIKISRIGLTLISFLFFFSGSLFATQQQVASEKIHYYLYEYTDRDSNKVAIIIEIASDNPIPPGSQFREVTAIELHQKGYLTPSESQQTAKVKDEHTDQVLGRFWGSWVNYDYTPNHRKWVDCGSATGYISGVVGPVFVRGSTWRGDFPGQPELIYEWYQYQQATWLKVDYHFEYADNLIFQWIQRGQHHWGDPQNMESSEASAIW
jgi:hypothetical protein